LLPKLYYCLGGLVTKNGKKNLIKKTNQKNPLQMVGSKLTCSKWHFSQVGHGGKKAIGGGFFTKIRGKKS
jgi:hypothetical protein